MTWAFEPTRQAGLERLTAFAPRAGRAYAATRNTDYGMDKTTGVSLLSPYLRRRMITEREVIEQTLAHHSSEAAEKFIQEVIWRTYWKGWLEMRPAVWDHYLNERTADLTNLPSGYDAAIKGETGIEGFDDWAKELVETGYLHNHARMWFASIWIFTLRLPWALGADFFYRHLVDADPAANTLSWRWVAGLHTKGKTYLARADNIEKFTQGRFRPTNLAPFAEPLIEGFTTPDPLPPREGLRRVPDEPYALLLTSDDLHPQSWPGYDANPPAMVIAIGQTPMERELNAGAIAQDFSQKAMADALKRIDRPVVACAPDAESIAKICRDNAVRQHGRGYALSGPTRSFCDTLDARLAADGIQGFEIKRNWDEAAWPLASAGFFKLKKKIPKLLAQAGLN